eukprot:CAMPEP_0177697048 /NCGR_PEP_ID=MMETSP0484_2-20121128/4306_1 /TAXON_ID=354590 /ORGANISM="Rhodomonas lens, Strain RHODO" /LENGTH=102 /DNA_ID=CAMNT_0019208061 /DNA_START=548 /DNA_END=856 /DNA_ORIENTATION=+
MALWSFSWTLGSDITLPVSNRACSTLASRAPLPSSAPRACLEQMCGASHIPRPSDPPRRESYSDSAWVLRRLTRHGWYQDTEDGPIGERRVLREGKESSWIP